MTATLELTAGDFALASRCLTTRETQLRAKKKSTAEVTELRRVLEATFTAWAQEQATT